MTDFCFLGHFLGFHVNQDINQCIHECHNFCSMLQIENLRKWRTNIEQSTMGTASEDDFDNLFEDLDLTSTKLGKSESQKNELISKVLAHLDKIDFKLDNTELDVLGYA